MTDNQTKIAQLLAYDNLSSSEIARRTGISQPTVSRTIKTMSVIKLGEGRNSRFAFVNPHSQSDLYQINQDGDILSIGQFVQQPNERSLVITQQQVFEFDSLPFFFYDMVPSGFLGGLFLKDINRRDSNISLESKNWLDNEILYFLQRYGDDLSGNLILGRNSAELAANLQYEVIKESHYDSITQNLINTTTGHSSVAGEQPKFTCFDGKNHLIVKYSPKKDQTNLVAQRHQDLLCCEHIALQTLNEFGIESAHTEIVQSERTYLKVQRFDRQGQFGRIGLISLRMVDAQYIGTNKDWVTIAKALHEQGLISPADFYQTQVIYAFGLLIGNTDMHNGNLSFYFEDLKPTGLAPVYDMLPMVFMPKQGEITYPGYPIPRLIHVEIEALNLAQNIAKSFWSTVQDSALISEEFKSLTVNFSKD